MRGRIPGPGWTFHGRSLPLAVLAACGAFPFTVAAQNARPDAAAASEAIETVVVTAQRRREPAREVPLTADVVRGEALERSGYQSLADLAALLPGVNYNEAGSGTGQSQVTMRGISTGSQVGATVSMYIDDVPFGSSSGYAGGGSSALDLGLFDLAAAEVLRGPQGTLYGAGAMGGLIKYVAVEPDTHERVANVTTELSNARHGELSHVARGVFNLPLSDGVAALRATLYQRKEGGFVHDRNHGGQVVDGSLTNGARVALLLTPSKDLSLRLTALTQSQQRDGSSTEDVQIATGQPVDGRQTKRLFVNEPVKVHNDLLSLAIKADLHWATLDAITGWQRSRNDGRADPSALYVPYLAPLGISAPGYALDYSFYNRKVSQEIRLTSPRSRVFEWLAGAFYTNEAGAKSQHLQPLNAAFEPVQPLLADAQFPSTFREAAVFGTGTYFFNERTDVTLGVRRSHNTQHLDQRFAGLFAPAPQPTAESSEDVTTWMATARWRPAPRHALYVRAASGYRPGGPLPVIRNPLTGEPLNKPSFASDTLWSYEAGWKGDLVPGKVSAELAVYQIDWKDMQVFTANAGFSGIGNAGRARSRGIEATLRAKPAEDVRVAAALSLIDAKLRDDSPDLGGKAGERLPDAARVAGAVQVDRDFSVDGNHAYLGASLRYTGERFNAFVRPPANPLYRLPAYTMIDLRGGIELGRASIGFFVRNLLDRRAQTSADTTLSAMGGPARINLAAPRTLGVQFSYAFF
ncbi:TonB-dependent receptor [Duganella sp. CY15W]|uniref:TonB-dependent receptor n=1 Tax=Duganella sp. CY15W TaxID=2692172 RepID=UPI00136CAE70|nr:TonB-dependent receptor [Duganella sp. CY15W]MYM27022.1 TonB-dependent receptor [Duganella sp. CY15W]